MVPSPGSQTEVSVEVPNAQEEIHEQPADLEAEPLTTTQSNLSPEPPITSQEVLPPDPPTTSQAGLSPELSTTDQLCMDNAAPDAGSSEVSYRVGARHPLTRACKLWSSSSAEKGCETCGCETCSLEPGCSVFLVRIERMANGQTMGLVTVGPTGDAGWLTLDGDLAEPNAQARRCPLGEPMPIWLLSHVYRTSGHLTLHSNITNNARSLIREIPRGEAVLLLELDLSPGFSRAGCDPRAQLRAKVRAGRGDVGWLTPESASGEPLLQFCDVVDSQSQDGRSTDLRSGQTSRNVTVTVCGEQAAVASRQVQEWSSRTRSYVSPGVHGDSTKRDLLSRFNGAEFGGPSPEDQGSAGRGDGRLFGVPSQGNGEALDGSDRFGSRAAATADRPPDQDDDQLLPYFASRASPSNAEKRALACGCNCTGQYQGCEGAEGCEGAGKCDTTPLSSWLHAVYARYNPGKLHRVCALLAEYQDREEELIDIIHKKYRVRKLPLSLLGSPPRPVA